MIQSSSSLALADSSLLICILGLVVTFVLLQEQRKMAGTNAAIAVSLSTPFCLVLVINLDI